MDLTSSRLWVGPAVDTTDVLVDRESPPPDEDAGHVASNQWIDLREHADVTWLPGAHIVTVPMRDRVSNRVTVELRSSTAQFRDEEAERYVAEKPGGTRSAPDVPSRFRHSAACFAEFLHRTLEAGHQLF